MTSTERLNASAKAIASHKEARTIRALIIMIKLNKATITVRALFSVKYFLITNGFTLELRESKCTEQMMEIQFAIGRKGKTFD
jgi:hypothetical protein